MKTTQASGSIDKENIAYAHGGILFCLKKGNSNICYNMNES